VAKSPPTGEACSNVGGMRRLALTLPALAAVAVTLAGCGDSSSPTTPAGGTSQTPPAGSQSAPAGGNAPANPTAAKAEIKHNWETFLSSNTSHAVAAGLL